jgi:DNA-binding MarR family transcriptional regulator
MIETVKSRRGVPPPLTSGPAYLIREAHKSLSRVLAAEVVRLGISLKQYYYVRALLEEDGISQVELGERVGMERATVTAALDTLERDGIVRREAHPDDRRKTNVFLTAKGKRLRAPLIALIKSLNEATLADVSRAELDRMCATIAKLARNADAYLAQLGQ